MSQTLSILNHLKTHLSGIALPALGGPLFELVEITLNKNLREAVRMLYVQKDRVALVVPLGDSFELLQENPQRVAVRRSLAVHLLIADRDWTNGREAALGGASTPGVLAMKDLVLDSFNGALPFVPLPVVEATEQYEVADAKDTHGRQFWVIELRFGLPELAATAPRVR